MMVKSIFLKRVLKGSSETACYVLVGQAVRRSKRYSTVLKVIYSNSTSRLFQVTGGYPLMYRVRSHR